MMETEYSLSQFVGDLKSIAVAVANEREILRQVAPLAERLAADSKLLNERPVDSIAEKGFSFNLLHEEADHALAVAILSWLPSGATLPHNHGTWGIVVGLKGSEKNIFWRRIDDGSRPGYAELERVGEMECLIGQNVYYTGRSQFDIVNKREMPWGTKT